MAVGRVEVKEVKGDRLTREEFGELVEKDEKRFYGLALYLEREPMRARELVQEALCKAYGSIDRFEPGTNFFAWVCRIIKNTFLNEVRKEKRAKFVDLDSMTGVDELFCDEGVLDDPDDILEAYYDVYRQVRKGIARVGDDFRMVIELVDLEGLSYQEVADELCLPIGTVMSRLYRGRKQLKAILEGAEVEDREN